MIRGSHRRCFRDTNERSGKQTSFLYAMLGSYLVDDPRSGNTASSLGTTRRRDPYSHETRLERYNPESRLGPTHHVSTFKWVLGGHLHKVPQHLLATQAGRVEYNQAKGRWPIERPSGPRRARTTPKPPFLSLITRFLFFLNPAPSQPSKTRHQMHIVQRSWRRQDQIP
jgi:hypothetical protein